jgi:tripartite-type tricarboxylate transporter receptor subunit TctC
MKLIRRQFVHLAFAAMSAPVWLESASALDYPTRPVHVVVGFAAGGGPDIIARLVGQWLSERLGQPIIVENRLGAGGNIGTESVANAPPDGYTLLLATSANAVSATLYDKLDFEFIRDITPVAAIMRTPNVMVVNPKFPARSVPEFIAYAKANPRKINMASSGSGGVVHVAGELFKMMTEIDMVHVPYRGEALALNDLLAGQVQVVFATMPGSIQHIRVGTLRPLAVTSVIRSEALPDIPTVAEFIPGYEASAWNGLGAPKDTPAEIISTLNKQVNAGLADPMIRARLADLGVTVIAGSPSDFRKLIVEDTRKWATVVRFSGAKPD